MKKKKKNDVWKPLAPSREQMIAMFADIRRESGELANVIEAKWIPSADTMIGWFQDAAASTGLNADDQAKAQRGVEDMQALRRSLDTYVSRLRAAFPEKQ